MPVTRCWISACYLLVTAFIATLSLPAFALSPPSSLSGSTADGTATVTWSAVDGAAGYNVYRDNAYVDTVFDTRWTDTLPEGTTAMYAVVAFSTAPVEFSAMSTRLTLPATAVPDDLTIPPSVPDGLVGEISGTTVTLGWDASSDDEAVAGYNIYRNGAYLDTVFATEWQGQVVDGERYLFSVVAFDVRRNFSAQSAPLLLPASMSSVEPGPPSVPAGLSGTFTGRGALADVTLSWDHSVDDGLVLGYNIYVNRVYVDTVLTNRYTTTLPADASYAFSVVAFDNDKRFSTSSEPLYLPAGDTPGPDVEAPTAPTGLVGRLTGATGATNSTGGTLELDWLASSDNRAVSGYNVYENNRYLTTVFETTFSKTVNDTSVRVYYVVAFDVAGNFSHRSERVSVPDSGNQAPYVPDLQDVLAYAGDTVTVDIAPIDVDGPAPGLFIGVLPEGMASDDNFDGSRTLRWRPLQPAVGEYTITVTSIDAEDTTLQTTQSFRLTIELPDDPSGIVNLPPVIDLIEPHVVRAGDTVVMEVKASDPNGTVPLLSLRNLPDSATFLPHPEFPTIRVLRWTTAADALGEVALVFEAVDAIDASLSTESTVMLDIHDPADFVRPGERLKTLAASRGLPIGYAALLDYYNRPDADLYESIASEEFNLVTAENAMKWGYVNPLPGTYRWDAADRLVAFAAEHEMAVHGHALVWYASLPQWVQQAPLDEREALMLDFIDTLTARYPNVAIWDVVNEAIEADGTYRNSTWYQAMGGAYIGKAFERARARAPDAVLLYNDYDIAMPGPKSDAVYALLRDELAAGTPIDGIGFQMHVDTGFDAVEAVADRFAAFAALGLDVYITELDVSILDGDSLDDQANVYAAVTRLCLAEPACKALQVWGITDRYSWLKAASPLLLDRDYQPKPAYVAVQEALAAD